MNAQDRAALAYKISTATIGHNHPPSLLDELRERHAALTKRRDELLEAAERAPSFVADDEVAGRIQDFTKQIMACRKSAEGLRVSEKEPHLEAGRQVDGFFKAIIDPLDAVKKKLEARLTAYLREKAEEERRAREEIERKAREAAAEAQRKADEALRKAREEADLEAAIVAEAAAQVAAADAAVAAKAADAKAADLSRTRGEFGSVGSLRTIWDFRNLDRATVDLQALRPYLPADALERAVRAFIRAGGRQLAGVEIFENTNAVVR